MRTTRRAAALAGILFFVGIGAGLPSVVGAADGSGAPRRAAEIDWTDTNARETRHQVAMALSEPDVALFTVSREFRPRVRGKAVWLQRGFALPSQAVVTSFAIRTDGEWRDGVLGPPSPFPALEDPQRPVPSPWSSLRLDGMPFGRELLHLKMGPTKSKGPIRIRYTLWVQAEPTRTGQRWRYCSEQQPEVPVIPPAGVRVSRDPEDDDCLFFEQRTTPRAGFSARYGTYTVADRQYWYLDLTAPHALVSPAPAPGPVVFVLDASRSQDEAVGEAGGLALQLEVVEAYLAHAPRAEVELVVFNRTAERVFGRFVPAAAFLRSLPRDLTKRPLRNGSFVEKGLEVAAKALVARGKPGRIVVLGDGELRAGFSARDALSILDQAPKPLLVHHLVPYRTHSEAPAITHSTDPSELHEIATRFGGAVYVLEVPERSSSALGKLVRRLISPDRIESLDLRLPDGTFLSRLAAFGRLDPDELSIADGYVRWSGIFRRTLPEEMTLEGWIWGRKVELPVRAGSGFEDRIPRLATAAFEMSYDAGYETRPCARIGATMQDALAGAFLARDLEFRVQGEGGGMLGSGEGTVSDPRCQPHVIGKGGPNLPDPPPPDPFFPTDVSAGVDGVARALAACGLMSEAAGDIKGTVETVGREIVDITVQGGPEQARHCIEESLWNVLLPPDFNERLRRSRQTYAFALSTLR